MKSRGRVILALLSAAWLLAVTAGLLLLADYDSKPGHPASPPSQWPSEVSLVRNPAKPILLMFLHPRCPCSRASLYELARLAYGERDQLDLHAVFAHPALVAADWSHSDLWTQAVANRNLRVVVDRGGLLAQQFGAKTSGQVLVYDRAGVLRFEGGITPGRGHAGDSFGRSMVRAIAASQASEASVHCAMCRIKSEPMALATGVEANDFANPDPLDKKGLMQPPAQPLRDPRLAPTAHFLPSQFQPTFGCSLAAEPQSNLKNF